MATRWEYHLEGLRTESATGADGCLVAPDPGGTVARGRAEETVRRLNELGAGGWEVVVVYPWTPGWGYLLKRPVPGGN